MPEKNLIVAAFPMDETLIFSSICKDADIVVAGDSKWPGCEAELRQELALAARTLGARGAIYLNSFFKTVRGPEYPRLVDSLQALGQYDNVYTHNPFSEELFQKIVALAASQAFGKVWIQALGGTVQRVHVLDRASYLRKIQLINDVYPRRIRTEDEKYGLAVNSVLGVEAFTPATFSQVMHSVALSMDEVLPFPDPWGFARSPYELERYAITCKLLQKAAAGKEIKTILEIGACEGLMTAQFQTEFPQASIRAVEPVPEFAARLQERFQNNTRVEVTFGSVTDVPLKADILSFSEVLYYVEDEIDNLLRRAQGQLLVTSNQDYLDRNLGDRLSALGWKSLYSQTLPCRFEPVDGENSNLFCRREGSVIRVWGRNFGS